MNEAYYYYKERAEHALQLAIIAELSLMRDLAERRFSYALLMEEEANKYK